MNHGREPGPCCPGSRRGQEFGSRPFVRELFDTGVCRPRPKTWKGPILGPARRGGRGRGPNDLADRACDGIRDPTAGAPADRAGHKGGAGKLRWSVSSGWRHCTTVCWPSRSPCWCWICGQTQPVQTALPPNCAPGEVLHRPGSWINHHALFAVVARVDRLLTFHNLLLLLFVATIPFTTWTHCPATLLVGGPTRVWPW